MHSPDRGGGVVNQEVVENLENMVRDILTNSVHTAMPGVILEYSPETGLANVQPVGSFYCGKVEMDYPVVPEVPVCITACAPDIAACVPIKAGDACLLVCAEQSLSAFLSETSEAQSNERFELTNCIAIPGLMKIPVDAQQEANEKEALVLTNGENKIVITEEKIEVTGDVQMEGNIEVKGDVSIEGSITLNGEVSAKGRLFVEGDIQATGNINGANTEG